MNSSSLAVDLTVLDLSAGSAALPEVENIDFAQSGSAAKPRLGVWFGEGVANALMARALLYRLAAHYSNADWVLLGPADSACFFEMDRPVTVFIPLLGLQRRRPSQSRLAYWWSARQQRRRLRAVGLQRVFGVQPEGHKEWIFLGRQLHCPCHPVRGSLDAFLSLPHPTLQAGPSALAYSTHIFRSTPPHKIKEVLFVGLHATDSQSLSALQASLDSIAEVNSVYVERVVAVLSELPDFMQRRLAEKHPDWHWVTVTQAFGLLGYADRVVAATNDITLIGHEMGRGALFVLDKTHS